MEYLAHYGIKGQKWGEKNGPPYPLGASQKSPSEKRYKISRIKSDISETSAKFNRAYNKALKDDEYDWTVESIKDEMGFYDDKTIKELGENFVADLKMTSQKLSRFNNILDPESKLPKKSKETSPEEDCLRVNPTGLNTAAYRLSPYINCTMCATAFELRRRGYNVMAKQKASPEELTLSMMLQDKYFSGKTKKYSSPSYKEFLSDVKKVEKTSKDGARGFVEYYYKKSHDGHILNYEIQNGQMVLFDSQSGDSADPATFLMEFSRPKKPGQYYRDFTITTNTQNLTPDYGAIRLLAIE